MPRALLCASAAVVALALAVALAACTSGAPMPTPTTASPSTTAARQGDGVLRIGTLFPSSGDTAFLGAAQLAGVKAAIRQINAAGGVEGKPVELVSADSGDASTQKAEQAYADFVTKGVDVVIGPSSSVLAQRLLPVAATAGIPMISPAATLPQLTAADTAGWFFRTATPYGHQGVLLARFLVQAKAKTVVLIASDDAPGQSITATLGGALRADGARLTQTFVLTAGVDLAAAVAQIATVAPDAVVLATPDNGAQTKALITQLSAAKLGGAKLWLTSQNLADYSQALPAGVLKDAQGVLEGAAVDPAFTTTLKAEDSGLGDTRYGAEAFDAAILAALAAIQAGDDAGSAIAAHLQAASAGGIKCASFAECLDVLVTGNDIDYDGVSGPVDLDAAGDPVFGYTGLYRYGPDNKFSLTGGAVG